VCAAYYAAARVSHPVCCGMHINLVSSGVMTNLPQGKRAMHHPHLAPVPLHSMQRHTTGALSSCTITRIPGHTAHLL
jgi:hypothetical protein